MHNLIETLHIMHVLSQFLVSCQLLQQHRPYVQQLLVVFHHIPTTMINVYCIANLSQVQRKHSLFGKIIVNKVIANECVKGRVGLIIQYDSNSV